MEDNKSGKGGGLEESRILNGQEDLLENVIFE